MDIYMDMYMYMYINIFLFSFIFMYHLYLTYRTFHTAPRASRAFHQSSPAVAAAPSRVSAACAGPALATTCAPRAVTQPAPWPLAGSRRDHASTAIQPSKWSRSVPWRRSVVCTATRSRPTTTGSSCCRRRGTVPPRQC